MQHAALKFDLSTARPLRDLVLAEIKNGVDLKWIATKYGHLGATLDRVLTAKAAIDKQKELQRERENAARGNREAPEVGPVSDAAGGVEAVRVDEAGSSDLGAQARGYADRQANG
jgi:hypothetical protein